jgi:thiosulfate/3-mercaptopyruvate sulfurtransferase
MGGNIMRRRSFVLVVLGVFLLAWAGNVNAAQWANPDLLVTPAIVESNIDNPDWVVIDCRDLKGYAKGHIPGAISLGKNCKTALRDPTVRIWKDISWYEKFLGKVGIGNDTHVVFYHDGIKTIHHSGVGFWVLEWLGHDKVHVLNGGIDAWRKAGKRLDKAPSRKPPKTYKANVVSSRLATTQEILEIATGAKTGVQLIDSRSKEEFLGKDCRAVRCGHVPNTSINVSHKDTVAQVMDKKTGEKKPTGYLDPDVLEAKFGKFDRNNRTIGYCQTGTRSSLTYLELRLMGFKDPANWDDSWRVYGSANENYPVDAPNGPQFYNFASVNKKIKNLEKTIKKLEAALKEKK